MKIVAGYILLLSLSLIVLSGCVRIGNPEGWSGGIVDGDVVVFGTAEGELRILDRDSGGLKCKFELKGEEDDRAIYGTPTVVDGRVYLGGYDGILYAISLGCNLEWQERVGGSIVGSPVVVDGVVLVGSSDGNLYAFEEDLDAGTAVEVWRFPTANKVWSTPSIKDGVVFFGSLDHNLYAVGLEDGVKRWHFTSQGAVVAGPVVHKDRVYVGSFDGTFYSIDVETGQEVWRFEGSDNWYWAQAVAFEDTIYAPSLDGTLYALDADTGRVRWEVETEGSIVGSPAIVEDMIAVASLDGKLRMVKIRDGSELYACNIGEDIRTPLTTSDDLVFFGAQDHSIRALRIKSNGNPDEEWVYITDKNPDKDGVARDRAPAC